MGLSSDLISAFVKATNDEKETKHETTVYATVVESDGRKYVKIDGSDLLTPVSSTAGSKAGDRVTVMIKNHAATITGNISSPSATSDNVVEMGTLIANKVSVSEFRAEQANIDALQADTVEITERLTANEADIETLKATSFEAITADIEQLKAHDVEITGRLEAAEGLIEDLGAVDLSAVNADIDNLEADMADINTLIFGSATGTTIQTSFANAIIALLGDAQIKSAMIESVAADKILAGDIITNDVRVVSEDGKLLISDETIQISDDTRVRVQIGKDASGDYSMNIWDVDGNLMFSEGGITDSAIKEAIIRNDMVSEDANISASKLDIDSLFTEINGSTNTIKSNRIYLDDEKQTLDVAFKEMETEVAEQGTKITTQGTQISAIQGQITSKVWQQDIDTATGEMETKYSTLEQSLEGFQTSVSETFADLEVGGRNLLRNTKAFTSVGGSSQVLAVKYLDFSVRYLDGTLYHESQTQKEFAQFSGQITPIPGQTYTLSFYAKGTGTIDTYFYGGSYAVIKGVSSQGSVRQAGDGNMTFTLSDEWTRYWITYTLETESTLSTSGAKNVLFRLFENNIAYVCGCKFEKGNKATDWTPNPDDMAAASDLSSYATKTEVEQTASDITATVSSTYVTKTDFNNLEIGGRNILFNSRGNSSLNWIHPAPAQEDDVKGSCLVRSTSLTSETYVGTPRTSRVEPSTVYTFSMDIYIDEYVKGVEVFWLSDTEAYPQTGSAYVNVNCLFTPTLTRGVWQRVSKSFVTKADDYTGYIRVDNNGSTVNGTAAVLKVANLKLEKGMHATDWTPAPEDLERDVTEMKLDIDGLSVEIGDAAKTATSFMGYDATNGLQIGNKTSGSWSGFRTQVAAQAFRILNSAGTVLASYGEKLVELGKNATDAVIKLCGGKGTIQYVTDEDSSTEYLEVTADKIRVRSNASDAMSSLYSTYTNNSTRWEKSAVNVTPAEISMYASECIDPTMVEKVEGWNTSEFDMSGTDISASADVVSITGRDGLFLQTDNGVAVINGMVFGMNQALWSGANHMGDGQTVTLSQAISAQKNGIVLVWSYYINGSSQDYSFNSHFVSKYEVAVKPNCPHTFLMAINAGLSTFGAKYVYISDNKLTGHVTNTGAGTAESGIKFSNDKYVLRYVIGV